MTVSARVEIIAHRGASRDRLENTMAAFICALEQGADAFELDVHATRDGVVVVHHDADILINAEDAKVPNGRRLTINTVDFTTLSGLRLRNGEAVPTLDDVLSLAAAKAAVYVEVKGIGIEVDVIKCLARHANTRTAVHSFDHRISHHIGMLNPGSPIGLLSASYLLDFTHLITTASARDLWQQTAMIDRALVKTAHRNGARVIAWTENSVQHAAELVQLGVDAICTDIPGEMRSGLRAAGVL
ncbi:MAG: glycerophosphodiester phosphodiesterase [Gemmatimonas sp.]